MRIIQDNLDQANKLNGMAPMLFETANLLNAINVGNNAILNKASSANREAASQLGYGPAVSIVENFEKKKNTPESNKLNKISFTSSGLGHFNDKSDRVLPDQLLEHDSGKNVLTSSQDKRSVTQSRTP